MSGSMKQSEMQLYKIRKAKYVNGLKSKARYWGEEGVGWLIW